MVRQHRGAAMASEPSVIADDVPRGGIPADVLKEPVPADVLKEPVPMEVLKEHV